MYNPCFITRHSLMWTCIRVICADVSLPFLMYSSNTLSAYIHFSFHHKVLATEACSFSASLVHFNALIYSSPITVILEQHQQC